MQQILGHLPLASARKLAKAGFQTSEFGHTRIRDPQTRTYRPRTKWAGSGPQKNRKSQAISDQDQFRISVNLGESRLSSERTVSGPNGLWIPDSDNSSLLTISLIVAAGEAWKLFQTQNQYRGQFPPTNDILFTLSQAELFEDFGVPISRHHISKTKDHEEQKDTSNDVGVGGGDRERGAAANHLLQGKLWNQHSNVANCDFESELSCKWLVPYYYAEGSNTQVRTHISSVRVSNWCFQDYALSQSNSELRASFWKPI